MKLKIERISKCFGKEFYALKNFSLDIESGVLGLLGPNGAGKSTLMRIVATITKPTSGTITWNGEDIVRKPNKIRPVLGYLPQEFGVYPNLNAYEFLRYMAAIKGLARKDAKTRVEELLNLVHLTDVRKYPLANFSGGMKQRIGIAQALLNDPQLLIVDEPTAGLDPEERVRFRNLLVDLSGERSVILSTHIVSDIEASATKIAIINMGQLLTTMTPEDFLKTVDGKVWQWRIPSSELMTVRAKYRISNLSRREDGLYIRIVEEERPHIDAESVPPSLEDAYLHIIHSYGRKNQ
ncbi:MAG: ABC transporter ATP-binding protein [Candidatus Heimdallarchaeota archaeon]|nr:MAG: ABC transporter ATP-binding protein [Candidatus Heimdallarchaeota archaeon]